MPILHPNLFDFGSLLANFECIVKIVLYKWYINYYKNL